MIAPYGFERCGRGGKDANYQVKKNEVGKEPWVSMGPKNMVLMQSGNRCVIHMPGGSRWGISWNRERGGGVKTEEVRRDAVHVPRAAGSLAVLEETQGAQH